MTPAGHPIPDDAIIQRAEALLESLTAVVSARVLFDEEKGAEVHVFATEEMPVSEVSLAVMSALVWGLGFDVESGRVNVIQSRLPREELNSLLVPKKAESSTQEQGPDRVPPDPPSPETSIPDTGLVEFSIGGSKSTEFDLPRLKLHDLTISRRPEGGQGILVRLGINGLSATALSEGGDTEQDMLELPAKAAIAAIQELLQLRQGEGQGVVLKLQGAGRLRYAQQDIVGVLVAAQINGRKVPLAGVAYAAQNVAQASIFATLQATNAFVAVALS
jgi:hypothetical protein